MTGLIHQATTRVVRAYLERSRTPITELPALIGAVNSGLKSLEPPPPPAKRKKPAVPVKYSIQNAYLICLEDGAQRKMLKRYLFTKFNMTPDEYRLKWGLPADYPMTAPAYTKLRSRKAKRTGLGTHVRRR